MAESEVRTQIERLRAQILALQSQPPCGGDWQSWYGDACSVLSSHYGVNSAELQGFLDIRFEIQVPLLDAQARLQSVIDSVLPSLATPLRISQVHYYQERLRDADEYFLTLLQHSTDR